jgi:CRP-like cAMP-binding protein
MAAMAVVPMIIRFKSLGVAAQDLDALAQLTRNHRRIAAGSDIIRAGQQAKHMSVLIEGLACWYKRLEDGRRRIYTFQHPGDICDLDRFLLPEADDAASVQALIECSVAAIDRSDIDRLVARKPSLALAFWRATALDSCILRERLLNISAPAVQRVANLLCEQLARREAIGLKNPVLALTQIDVADACGLSPVHVNRTIQVLRNLKVLSKSCPIEVVDKRRLADIARFDGRYLSVSRLSNWTIDVAAIQRTW